MTAPSHSVTFDFSGTEDLLRNGETYYASITLDGGSLYTIRFREWDEEDPDDWWWEDEENILICFESTGD